QRSLRRVPLAACPPVLFFSRLLPTGAPGLPDPGYTTLPLPHRRWGRPGGGTFFYIPPVPLAACPPVLFFSRLLPTGAPDLPDPGYPTYFFSPGATGGLPASASLRSDLPPLPRGEVDE